MRMVGWLVAILLVGSCAALGGVNDGTTLSRGATNGGRLVNGQQLPVVGDGYRVPAKWRRRGNTWGTDEMIALLVRTARRLAAFQPDGPLYVADISPHRGGASLWHRSHQTGRDVDILFFAIDASGRLLGPPEDMIRFDAMGESTATNVDGWRQPRVRFDVARNWALVRTLLTDPWVDVQYVFVADWLRALLLAHATEIGEPLELLVRAREILRQPVGALPHDDHFHVRVYCSADDRMLGCQDRGPLRWLKKQLKYGRYGELVTAGAGHFDVRPIPGGLDALGAAPFQRAVARALFTHLLVDRMAGLLGRAPRLLASPRVMSGVH